jgi:hypothetical protein
MNVSKLWQKSLCHILREKIDDYELRKIEGQLKKLRKIIEKYSHCMICI